MALSALNDDLRKPDEESLKNALGEVAEAWFSLIKGLSTRYPSISEEWAYPGQKYGWSLRLVHKKRRLVYLTPQEGKFLAALVLSDRAVEAANKSALSQDVLAELNSARKYAEGRGIRLEIKSAENLNTLELLIEIKINN
jgi:hypothetical protein